jgi:hypothetical protein
MLTGLLFDEMGNRYTPSHAVKDGKRYRYYISQAVVKDASVRSSCPTRVAAGEVENVVVEVLREFLGRKRELRRLLLRNARRAEMGSLSKIEELRASFASGSVSKSLREFVDRVILRPTAIDVVLSKNRLRITLVGPVASSQYRNGQDVIQLSKKFRFARCGSEKRILAPGGTRQPSAPVQSLLKAIARAHDWYEKLTSGEAESRRDLRKILEVDESYIGRIIRCAFLAPEIVELILEGKQPPHLSLQVLQSSVPASWAEQRRLYGLASRS